jgi:hypothetical protein
MAGVKYAPFKPHHARIVIDFAQEASTVTRI